MGCMSIACTRMACLIVDCLGYQHSSLIFSRMYEWKAFQSCWFRDKAEKSPNLLLTLNGYQLWSLVCFCCYDICKYSMVFSRIFFQWLINQLVKIIIRRFIKNTLRLFEWDKYKTVTINKSNIYWLALNFVTQLLWYFRRIGAVLY